MTNSTKPIINPYLAVLLGVLAASFSAIFTKLADAPALIIAFYRLAFTVLLLAPLAFATGRQELKHISGRDLLLAVLSGVLLAMHFATWVTSLNYTTVASSTVLVTMQPLFVIAGGYFLYKEKISRKGLAGAGLALTGSIIIGINDFQVGGQALLGDLLAFAGAIFVAGYVLIGRSLRFRLSLFTYVTLVYSASAVTLMLCSLVMELPFYPYDGATWMWFLMLAVIPTIFGHTVFNWALRYVKAAVVSVSILGEPVGATILAYFIFGEVPTMLQLLGGAVIITGLYIFITSTVEKPKATGSKERVVS
ncbi:DMT family transporter [Desulfofalx alkaliphila]|uniref:DMT family transporter n=1 Tax=Desulfofalx alkaliphila TaxID=105483 RepID=UPI0004E17C2A|nr:DMT family transporter [Desulfofalx alkaliphila]